MDSEKRKREIEDNVTTNKKFMKNNTKAEDEGQEEEEEEIQEFFAILRRIHVAVKYFEKSDGSGRSLTAPTAAHTWKPSFQAEDFLEDNDAVKDQTDTEDGLSLDLNSDPAIEVQRSDDDNDVVH